MASIWKKMQTDDNREILFALIKCKDLDEAGKKVRKAIDFLKLHKADKQSHMSLSSESFSIVLHAYSSEPIGQHDWDLAKQLEKALNG